MQHEYSCQTSPSKSDQIDWKVDDIINSEDENTGSASTVSGMKLRDVMTQREMEILTTWFPKASKTLACVLRKIRD
jgi:hypothetical protein